MLSLDDNRWGTLTGAYRMKCDPRPLLAKLESGRDRATTWHELWDELHHQGGVGDASYAAVPHIVSIHQKHGVVDWNTYAIVACIESARTRGKNPKVPEWLEKDYFRSIQELAQIGISEISRTDEPPPNSTLRITLQWDVRPPFGGLHPLKYVHSRHGVLQHKNGHYYGHQGAGSSIRY
jgi:hypothetical protein